ncbi:hypothetical protein V3C99_010014 [Haemonchus contortus]
MKLLISFCFFAVTAAHPSFYLMQMVHPPFLVDVSSEARLDYRKIFVDKKLTMAQQKEEIKAWAKENNLTNEVKSFFSRIGKGVVEMNQKIAKLVDDLPVVFGNYTKIMKNENQTMLQMMEAIQKLKAEHPSAFVVLGSAMEQVMGENEQNGPSLKAHERRRPIDGPFVSRLNTRTDKRPIPFDHEEHLRMGAWQNGPFRGPNPFKKMRAML